MPYEWPNQRPRAAEHARERLSECARGARLMVTPIYARKGRFPLKIGAHTTCTYRTYIARAAGTPIMYGESEDPTKMTYSKMAFASRPCGSCCSSARTTRHAYASSRIMSARATRRRIARRKRRQEERRGLRQAAGRARLVRTCTTSTINEKKKKPPKGNEHARGSNPSPAVDM